MFVVHKNKMSKECSSQNFAVRFDNGIEVSVAFGTGTYSSNRNNSGDLPSSTAEVMVFDTLGELNEESIAHHPAFIGGLKGSNPTGWVRPDQLVKILAAAEKFRREYTY